MADQDVAQTKVCGKCGEAKPATKAFFPAERERLRGKCRICRAADKRATLARESPEARERRFARGRDYVAAKSEFIKEYKRTYRRQNAERLATIARDYYLLHAEKIKARTRRWGAKNASKKQARNKVWASQNRTATLSHYAKSKAKRRQQGNVRLSEAVSTQIWFSLKGRKGNRRWESLVGYTLADLMRHLERQFIKGMSWENYGRNGWHIDHIRPVSGFIFTCPSDPDFRDCWSLTNLRPMWEPDNISKGAKRLLLI